jgi:O-acetyl-ADP-ribose deacetylase (regulator of RNase III)
MRYIKGDLVKLANEKNYFDVIVHGCNCFCTMGSGIARQIRDLWPQVYKADCLTEMGDKNKLGCYTFCQVWTKSQKPLVVFNAYTQYNYGRDKVQADYDAIRKVFRCLAESGYLNGMRIGLPMIGCGLAGGDWNIVEKIIEEELEGFDVTIVEYSTTGF